MIQPKGNKVLIRPHEAEDATQGGIILANKKKSDTGTVIAVSEDFEASVKEGDKVKYLPNPAVEMEDGTVLIPEDCILYVLNN